MKLGCAFAYRLTGEAQRIIQVVRVGIGLPWRPKEAAEFTIDVTDVRRIEMPIDIEISRASVLLPTNRIGEFAERVKVIRIKERNAILEREPFAVLDFSG